MIEIFGFLQEFNDSAEVFKKHIEIQHDWVPTELVPFVWTVFPRR